MRQPPKFAQKYTRQARLPRAAYDGLTSGLNYYAQKRTKYCPNHPQSMIDDKYDVCYHCHLKKKTT